MFLRYNQDNCFVIQSAPFTAKEFGLSQHVLVVASPVLALLDLEARERRKHGFCVACTHEDDIKPESAITQEYCVILKL